MLAFLQRMNRPLYAVLAVAAIAAALRFANLSSPMVRVFDEFYYSKAGCVLVGGTDKQCDIVSGDEKYWVENKWDVGSWVHPPLGKWMIGLGEKFVGFDPFGWRVASATVGTLSCVLIAVTAQLLWGSPLWTFVAGLLLSVEDLNLVLSRTALLDIFLVFWVVVGFLCLVLDKRWIEKRTPPVPEPTEEEPEPPVPRTPAPVWRPWRYAAGIALGAAVSTKWSGVTAIFGALILSYAWESTRRRRGDVSSLKAFRRAFTWETFGLLLAFFVLPAGVYVATYLPWFHHFGWSIDAWWQNQAQMYDYHRNLTATALDVKTHEYTPTHPYYSRPWMWLPMIRPVSFFAKQGSGTEREILAIGNPVIFWGSLFALPYAAWMWRRRRDWRAGFVLVTALAQYLPWFLVSRPQFFFYVAPIVPYLVLADVYVIRDLSDATIVQRDPVTGSLVESSRHPYRPLAWIAVAAAAGLFIWFYPVLTARILSYDWWRARVWFTRWI